MGKRKGRQLGVSDAKPASADPQTSTITVTLSDTVVRNLFRCGSLGMALGFVLLLVDRTQGLDLPQAIGLAAIIGSSAVLVTSAIGRSRARRRRS